MYNDFYDQLATTKLAPWLNTLPALVDGAMALDAHGNMPQWQAALAALPQIVPSSVEFADCVRVGDSADTNPQTQTELTQQLRHFHPWRKGPFDLFGIHIDTEWRSDWKWDRLKDHIAPLAGKRVLDVGCGNGYHCWRMLGAGARQIIGLDPFLVYVMQYHAVAKLAAVANAPTVLPVGIEALPDQLRAFDTVFSMGVLYHRRSPIDHLLKLRDSLRSGGELVLETLVIDGALGEVLVPEGRYAQMRNVWFIPSVLTLESWLRKCRFKNVRVVDVTTTTTQEQRTTEWMTFNSLADFLDPSDVGNSAEGHPAPKRAILLANSP